MGHQKGLLGGPEDVTLGGAEGGRTQRIQIAAAAPAVPLPGSPFPGRTTLFIRNLARTDAGNATVYIGFPGPDGEKDDSNMDELGERESKTYNVADGAIVYAYATTDLTVLVEEM